jgi:hypothetical protein
VRYLRELRRCRHERQVERLARAHPGIHAARRLHERGGATPVEVQARLLARQSFEEVARRTSVPAEAVKSYEALFFNVVGHLAARDWVMTQAILRGHPASGATAQAAVLLKRFGYFGGAAVLESVMPYVIGGRDLWADPPDLATAQGRLDQKVRITVALEMLPQDARTGWKLARTFRERLLRERKAPSPGSTAALLGEKNGQTVALFLADALASTFRRGGWCPEIPEMGEAGVRA